MDYRERLMEYEKEKSKLRMQGLNDKEYEAKLKEIVRRLKI